MKRISKFVLCVAACAVFQVATAPSAFAAPILGTAGSYAVLAGSTVTNTGGTVLTGDLGLSPGSSITGFFGTTANEGPGMVIGGVVNQTNAAAVQAQVDLVTAYNALAGLSPTGNLSGQDLGGKTLTSGVYNFTSSAQLTGDLILNAQGLTNQFWVFQIGSTLTTASASSVQFINGTGAVYWQVGSSATLGTTTSFQGNILALSSIGLDTGAKIGCGSALARNGAVTLDTNTISTGCNGSLTLGDNGGGVILPPPGTPVPEPGTLLLLGTGIGIAGLGARRKRTNLSLKA